MICIIGRLLDSHLELVFVPKVRPRHGLLVLVDIEPDGRVEVKVDKLLLKRLPDGHDGL